MYENAKTVKNKYRRDSYRLRNWNYGKAALYFITISSQNRMPYFGEIKKNLAGIQTMKLSDLGKIVTSEWVRTFELREDMNLFMGEYVVMPDHFHAIIGIGKNRYNLDLDGMHCRGAMHCAPTMQNEPQNKFGPQTKNLASIVRGFKSSVTVGARKMKIDFQWQSRYHDHIIRNDGSYDRISHYIRNNPANWKDGNFVIHDLP